MDSSKLKVILVIVFAAFAALYLGVAAATAQMEAIAWVAGAVIVAFVLALGKHVWVLIPITLALAGTINAIPGSPAPWWAATMTVFAMFLMRFLSRVRDTFVFRFTWLDFAILLQVLAVSQAFIRNPAGLSIFGGDVVGGKPYIAFGMSFAAYFLLSIVPTELKLVKSTVILIIFMAICDGGLMITTTLFPAVGAATIPIYSGADFNASTDQSTNIDLSEIRLMPALILGKALGLAAFTLFRPISTLNPLKPISFLMMTSSLGLILLSGFRSALGMLAIYAVVSSLVRNRTSDVVIAGFLGMVALSLLIVTGSARHLPFGAQRILSILPIEVEDRAREDATNSSEWRFEMWKLALTTDRYIQNKWLGDGFSFRSDELAMMRDVASNTQRTTGGLNDQDLMMAKGSYHGFHVEAIRMTGALGLLCALISMGIFFRYAWKQIQYFRGRPEWGFVLFLCIPYLITPFYVMLVFGAYRNGLPLILVGAGMIKLLDNIRVRELAAAQLEAQNTETETSQMSRLSPGRSPHTA
ncbi:MAG: hypothetical protein OSA84_08290 [Akkermansiaceae bacterium]|nr:hypothetical protein [Akkermansiaceae bacterium]